MNRRDDTGNIQQSDNILSLKKSNGHFPKAAINFIDTLLAVQRDRFEAEMAEQQKQIDGIHTFALKPSSAHLFAEGDNFIGAGWSELGHRRDNTGFRWMGRIGTLMVAIDLSQGRRFSLFGCGFTKRRFLKDTTLWLDDQPLAFDLKRRGFNRWYMEGTLPVMPPRGYYIFRIQSSGTARLAEGVDAFVSLAISELRVNC